MEGSTGDPVFRAGPRGGVSIEYKIEEGSEEGRREGGKRYREKMKRKDNGRRP